MRMLNRLWMPFLMFVMCAFPAHAITNGTAELVWDDPGKPEWKLEIEQKSFANPTWQTGTISTPSVSSGKAKGTITFPPFPADTLTDHYFCVRARFRNTNATVKNLSGWAPDDNGLCAQVPVPLLPPPVPTLPQNLQLSSADEDTLKVAANPDACQGVTVTLSGLTAYVACLEK